MTASPLVVAVNALITIFGLLVVGQSYRGAVRNRSRPLGFFGLGIGLLTVVPTVLYVIQTLLFTDALFFDLVLLARVGGLLSLVYAFTQPNSG